MYSYLPATTPWLLLLCAAPAALFAMWTAWYAKNRRQPEPIFCVPLVMWVAALQAQFWMSPDKDGWLWAAYAVVTLASLAFLLGTSILCTGVMKMCDGELCINKGHPGTRWLIIWSGRANFKLSGKSLCSISWVSALLLLFIPIFGAVMITFALLYSMIVCFFTGQNPFWMTREILKFGPWPRLETKLTKRGLWRAPGYYLLTLGIIGTLCWLVYLLFTRTGFLHITGLVLLCLAGLAALFLISSWLSVRFMKSSVVQSAEQSPTDEVGQYRAQLANQDWRDFGDLIMAPFAVISLFWQVFRQKFCPKIRFMEGDEYDAADGTV